MQKRSKYNLDGLLGDIDRSGASAPASKPAPAPMAGMLDSALAGSADAPQGLTSDQMLGLALISLATPLAGFALGGRDGAMAGGAAGLSAAAGGAKAIGDKQDEDEKFGRAAAAKAADRAERVEDAITIDKAKAENRPAPRPNYGRNAKDQPINLDTGEVIDDSEKPVRPAKAPAAEKAPKTPDNGRGEDKLRGDHSKHPVTKRTAEIEQAFGSMQKASATAAGDLSLIFQYMKMLDPGSVVREGEFANAQNTAGVPDRVRNAYNKAISGERLNDDQRKAFIGEASSIVAAQREVQGALDREYGDIATRRGQDPKNVIVNPFRDAAPSSQVENNEGPSPEEAAAELERRKRERESKGK